MNLINCTIQELKEISALLKKKGLVVEKKIHDKVGEIR